ncbi:MAG TPA: endolytic transglycosylase MltG [Nevskiaceae bacterium]
MKDAGQKAARARRRHVRILRLCAALAAALPVVAIGVVAAGYVKLHQPLAVRQPITIDIASGQGLDRIVHALETERILAGRGQAIYLRAWARVSGRARAIRAGEYAVRPGMTPVDLLALLSSNEVVLHQLTIVDGWRFAQLWQAVSEAPALQHTMAPATPPADVMAAIGDAGETAEGRFFPDTYSFPRGETDVAVLRRAHAAMASHLQQAWTDRAADLPLASATQALILASIVQKETAQPDELARVSGVFVRRLQIGMRLQTDPTVIYGLGAHFDGNLTKQQLQADTPYNTYTRTGLPPTPICLPGAAALRAAVHPDEGAALYFVAKGDGTHVFADTLSQQNANVRRYQLRQK